MARSHYKSGIMGAIAGMCVGVVVGGCGGGSAGTPPAVTGATRSASVAESASGGQSAPVSSTGPGTSAVGVTGKFCTDFSNMRYHISTIPPRDNGNLPALKQDAIRLLSQSAAYF